MGTERCRRIASAFVMELSSVSRQSCKGNAKRLSEGALVQRPCLGGEMLILGDTRDAGPVFCVAAGRGGMFVCRAILR